MIILRLQFFLLLNIFLNHFLIEFLVIFFWHFKFIDTTNLPHRTGLVLTTSITESTPFSLSTFLQFLKPIRIFTRYLLWIYLCKFKFFNFFLKCLRIILVSKLILCTISINNFRNWPFMIINFLLIRIKHLIICILYHGLIIDEILFTFHLKLCVLIACTNIIRSHVPTHLYYFLEHLKGISLANIKISIL